MTTSQPSSLLCWHGSPSAFFVQNVFDSSLDQLVSETYWLVSGQLYLMDHILTDVSGRQPNHGSDEWIKPGAFAPCPPKDWVSSRPKQILRHSTEVLVPHFTYWGGFEKVTLFRWISSPPIKLGLWCIPIMRKLIEESY